MFQKSSYNASEVVMLDEGIEYMKHSETISKTKKLGTPTADKKKKKTAGKISVTAFYFFVISAYTFLNI